MYGTKETQAVGGALTFKDLYLWAVALAKNPRKFLAGIEKTGGYLTPVFYLMFWSFASSLVSFFTAFARPSIATGGVGLRVASLVVSPLVGLLGGFIFSAILFVVWHLMGSKEDFQTAFRVWAFIAPVSLVGAVLGLVPYLPILMFPVLVYLIVVASEEVHGLPEGRSWLVWGLLAGGLLILGSLGIAFQQVSRNMALSPTSNRFSVPRGTR